MKQLGAIATGSQSLVPISDAPLQRNEADKMLVHRQHTRAMPVLFNLTTDREIPDRAWEPWIRDDGTARVLRRALSPLERGAIQARRDELAPWVAGYHPTELDEVALALIDMLMGFPSGAFSAEAGSGRVDSLAILLKKYPAWAIERVCQRIRTRGYVRDGKTERHWPPADPEICDMMDEEMRLYARTHGDMVKLLTAEVAGAEEA